MTLDLRAKGRPNPTVLKLRLGAPAALSNVLAIGSHADDIEIGCGGTILELGRAFPDVEMWWVVLSASEDRAAEVRRSAEAFLANAGSHRVVVETFRDGFFPYDGGAIKEFFESLKSQISPDLIFTHHGMDLHQDHRIVSELTWNTFRDHLILEYEVPKYDGDFGSPNVFVHLSELAARRKVESLVTHFTSQRQRRWFTDDVFFATMRLRGMESNAPSTYAEAFYGRKVVL